MSGKADQRLDITIVPPERGVEKVACRAVAAQRQGLVEDRPTPHGKVYGIHASRPLALRPPAFSCDKLDTNDPGETSGDLVLHIEYIGARLVETLSPEVRTGCRIDQLRVHPDAVTAALHTAFHHIAHAELTADHPCVHRFVLEGESGIACDDEGARDAG